MKELLQLVRQYVAGEIDYPAFRRAMVAGFQSSRNADLAIQNAVNAIADASMDFSESLISQEELKRKVVLAVQARTASIGASIVFSVSDFDCQMLQVSKNSDLIPWGARFGFPISASGTVASSDPSSAPSNWPVWPNIVTKDLTPA